MKIKQTLRRFYEFLITNRGIGHTSLLNQIANENDVYIIVHSMEAKKSFNPDIHDKLIPIDKISILQAAPNKPVLLDNKVLMDLLDDTLSLIENRETKISKQKQTIQSIKDILDRCEM